MVVSMLVWSAVLMASFELARVERAYDYRSFFKVLLGRGWFVFEIGYFLLMLVILAVMGAAAGEIVPSLFGLPKRSEEHTSEIQALMRYSYADLCLQRQID